MLKLATLLPRCSEVAFFALLSLLLLALSAPFSLAAANASENKTTSTSINHSTEKLKVATPPPTFTIGSKFSRTVQTVTGINFLTEVVANQASKIILQRKLGGKVRVRIKTYSLTDLIAGKVKAVSVDVDQPKLKGVGLGDLSVASQNPIWFNYRKKNGAIGLKAPTMLFMRAELSQEQIAEALKTPRLVASMSGLKLDLPGLGEQQLEVMKPAVHIVGDMLKLEATLVTKGASIDTGVPIKISARPKLVGDSKIMLEDLQVEGPDIVEPEKFAQFAQDLLNPLIDFARMDRRDHAFRLADLQVGDGGVSGDGKLLLVPKDVAGDSKVDSTKK
ncbi:LmeA family phospholipid-binding protein [bacterium]|nr:LmeA family phospholipid-binding protein [bacterium]